MTSQTHRYITNEDIQKAEADARLEDARRRVQTGPPAGFADVGGLFKVLLILGWAQLIGWAIGAAVLLLTLLAVAAS